jgi:molecular chaperone DnaK (HSP70)
MIGIDLGTTSSSVVYVDTQHPTLSLQLFSIPQLVGINHVETLPILPSFCYLAAVDEWPKKALKLPWKEESATFVGQFAKEQGGRVPTRLVQSAKSWLCNAAAQRYDPILPLEAADPSQRLSPVQASANYLIHLKESWNTIKAKTDPSSEFEEQEIILTVPASFDEVARTLTVEAARLAGLLSVTLLEEPQAAFYSWIAQHEHNWQEQLKEGEQILVCDVGGGTTDFSLIEVKQSSKGLVFQRQAVGNHLLLGGDNMDRALAHYLEQSLQQQGYPALSSVQWLQLLAEARTAKEALLQENVDSNQAYSIVLQGTGSSVVRGSLSISIRRSEVENLLLEGFFGQYEMADALHQQKIRGFRTMGLPYEDEPSITKHLARFLQQANDLEKGIDHVLFNGGAMKPKIFQEAIFQSLYRWFPQKAPLQLVSQSLDLAVARGAAYYGKVRRGLGVVIGGGLPRSYYLEIDVKDGERVVSKALTLLPRGTEEGTLFQPNELFWLQPNTPVAFHLWTSHIRLNDFPGDLIDLNAEEMQRLPPIQTILRFGRKVQVEQQERIPVRLGIQLTAIGTVELWLESQKTPHRWNLEFQLRTQSGQENSLLSVPSQRQDETYESEYLVEAKQTLQEFFSPSSKIRPIEIMEKLEDLLSQPRRDWSPSLLRGLWEPLLKAAPRRHLSSSHEARWWNLTGFFLRPGFGFPLDDFRMKELWKILLGDLKAMKPLDCQIQMWICFRRIAGGLNKGQQMQIASEILSSLFSKKSGKIEIRNKGDLYAYSEKIRALAALERIDLTLKIRLGEALLIRIKQNEGQTFDYWALGRIGARHLVYGSIGQVVPKDVCAKWVEELLALKHFQAEMRRFVLGQLARQTEHRELNLPPSLIGKILEHEPNLKDFLLHERPLNPKEQEQVLGDQLPTGLMLEL